MDRTLITGDTTGFADEFLSDAPYVTAHTSGSTGSPKEIRLLKSDMLASARATCSFFGLSRQSRLVCPLSTGYIAGKMMVVRALVAGARLDIVRPSSSPLAEWDGTHRISLLPVVPSQTEALIADSKLAMVDNLLIGGGALSPTQEQMLASTGIAAWAGYGMTETCSHVALRRIGDSDGRYEAMPGITFSTDSRSCLVIDIPSMSIGRITTNDIVELLSDKHFRWKGRHDNVINSGGVKIHPETDEALLAPHMGAETKFYITSRPSEKWGREAVLVVTGSNLGDNEIMDICRRILPRHHVPKAVVRDPSPSYTSSGKLIRRRF